MSRNRVFVAILVASLAVVALLLMLRAPGPATLHVGGSDSGQALTTATPSPTARPTGATPTPTPRGKEIYKGHTLEEIRADPSLLAEVLAEADYIGPIQGEPDPAPTLAANAFNVARLALMEATGSNCESSHEGQMAVESIDFEGMAAELGSEGGVLRDGRGWVGTIDDARQHFGAAQFVAEDPGEHWFITNDSKTLSLLYATVGPAAAALIAAPLSDGRTVWYLGPRWFVSIPC
jgi:hypothetical protein